MNKPIFNRLRAALACAFALSVLLSANCLANIDDFNAAVRKGDYLSASKETQAIWRDYDKSKSTAATLAREFAFVNYMAGDFEAAALFVDELNEGAIIDNQPAVTSVLAAAIDYRRSDTVKNLDQLAEALERRLAVDGLDNISVVASDLLTAGYWNHNRWQKVPAAGSVANRLYERGGSSLNSRIYHTDIFATAASFLASSKLDDYHKMSDIHDAIVEDINAAEPGPQKQELVDLMFMSQAWSQAMYASYRSYHPSTGTYIDQNQRQRELQWPTVPIFESVSDRAVEEECDTELVTRKLRYPKVAAYNGTVGTVITHLQFDEDGKVTDSEILASVPAGIFAQSVMEHADEFYLKKSAGQEDCQFPASKVQSFSFVIR